MYILQLQYFIYIIHHIPLRMEIVIKYINYSLHRTSSPGIVTVTVPTPATDPVCFISFIPYIELHTHL